MSTEVGGSGGGREKESLGVAVTGSLDDPCLQAGDVTGAEGRGLVSP